MFRLCVLFAFFTCLSTPAATFVVTSLADSRKAGTLRSAIASANAEPGSTIEFDVSGAIALRSALPAIESPTAIDGTTAPGFGGTPLVAIDFAGQRGLTVKKTAGRSEIRGLSLVRTKDAGLTLEASNVTVSGNFIGLWPDGSKGANGGDGVRIVAPSKKNLIGAVNPVSGINYFDAPKGLEGWLGLNPDTQNTNGLLLAGVAGSEGVLYRGPQDGSGRSLAVKVPNATTTVAWGASNVAGSGLRVVGAFQRGGDDGHGFVWEGSAGDLPNGGAYRTVDYQDAKFTVMAATSGQLAVGNAVRRAKNGRPEGASVAFLYDVRTRAFARIAYPKAASTVVTGIWFNAPNPYTGDSLYTICGGYSDAAENNLTSPTQPLPGSRGFLVDYDASTGKFSNWKSFRYRNGNAGNYDTQFNGIGGKEPGVYTLGANSVPRNSGARASGSWVSVLRDSSNNFKSGQWVDLDFPQSQRATNCVGAYGPQVAGNAGTPCQAKVQIGFTLSNVISGNAGSGIYMEGSKKNVIAQNYIGTDPQGKKAVPNRKNGIHVTNRSDRNLIGGFEAGDNDPTGNKGAEAPSVIVPPQGNLISGNRGEGVRIDRNSQRNVLAGNFIGTNRSGNQPLGNAKNGVSLDRADRTSLLGCTVYQNPFVFYNVIGGNGRNGLRVKSSDNVTVQANFIGAKANNSGGVGNNGDGMLVSGSSRNTVVGGIIPLGNVISGNDGNGIAVVDTASGFLTFNTFGGVLAFAGDAPNGGDGILITSTGGGQVVRTCIISANNGNGIHIGGNASGVEVTDTGSGTNTALNEPRPNGLHGLLIDGTAHDNQIGGLEPSVEARNHFSGNLGYGIAVVGQARDNIIFGNNVGLGDILSGGVEPPLPNQTGGIYLGPGTSRTTIGGDGSEPLRNKISTNVGTGLSIFSSTENIVTGNTIQENIDTGLYATGPCTGTSISGNLITDNGTDPADNVDIGTASGITYTP